MRISTSQFHSQGFNSIQKHQNDILEVQIQLSTGKRVNKPGDDPVATSQIHSLNRTMNTINQYEANGKYAKSQLSLEETQLDTAVGVAQRARELTLQMMNETYTPENRQASSKEVGQLISHLQNIINSNNSGGELLFAGNNVDATAAFVKDPANSGALQPGNEFFAYIGSQNAGADFDPQANTGARFVQVGFDNDDKATSDDRGDPSRVRVTDNGSKIFNVAGAQSVPAGVDPTLINVLVTLKDNLDQGLAPPATVGEDLATSIKSLSSHLAEIGGRQNRIEAQYDAGRSFNMALEERRMTVEDMDIVEGISQLTQKQNALQMAQQVFTKVQEMSLFNYFR